MINIFISVLVLVFLGVGFTYGVDYSGIHRTFLLLNSTLINEGVITADDENPKPYFYKDVFEEKCINFLGDNLRKYTSKFDVGFYYLNGEDNSYCEAQCNGVRVSLKANVVFGITYSNAFIYTIGVSL